MQRRRLVTRLVVLGSPVLLLTLFATSLLMSDAEWTPSGGEALPREGPCVCERDDLLKQLEQLKKLVRHLEERLGKQQQQQQQQQGDNTRHESRRNELPCSVSYIKKQIEQSELERGKRWHNEFEVVPHAFFTLGAFYATETGMGRRVVERAIGTRRLDLQEAVSSALSVLNRQHESSGRYAAQDLVEGLYRIDPIEGTQYELWFERKAANSSSRLIKVALLRPHAPIAAVSVEKNDAQQQYKSPIVNVVVPLSGRLGALKAFLQRFHKNVLSALQSSEIHLTVVAFGDDDWPDVRKAVLAFETEARFSNFHLLNINSTFSRARGLQAGVDHWERTQDDVVLFFCDVDVDFDAVFIDRCKRNTIKKRQAYFPIVFSQFNPNVTRRLSPGHKDEHRLHKDAGFWRDFGFGMMCAYRSDFIELGGFRGDDTSGWGGEDLFLYRKFVRSPLRVVRSPDPNLFHLWHVKHCPSTLSPAQRRACLQSKGRNEASYDQLAFLLFANEPAKN